MPGVQNDEAAFLGLLAKIKASQPLEDDDRIAFSCLVQSHPDWITDPPLPETVVKTVVETVEVEKQVEVEKIVTVPSPPKIQYLEVEKPIATTLQVWGAVVYLVLWFAGILFAAILIPAVVAQILRVIRGY